MTEYACSVCQYTSPLKENVLRHINKKKSCGSGIKEIIEIPVEVRCEFCSKTFSSVPNLKNHIKKACKQKDKVKDEEIRKLKEELREAKKIVNIDKSTNNITINIMINSYENTSLDGLSDKIYNKIIKDIEEPYKMIPRLIKHMHFNPKFPENHNVYLSNRSKNNKHLQVYRNGQWEITDKNTEIDNLINDKETILGDWVAENGETFSEAMEKYNDYLDQKYDDDTAKLMKEEVELLLYNGRYMIKRVD